MNGNVDPVAVLGQYVIENIKLRVKINELMVENQSLRENQKEQEKEPENAERTP